MGEQQDDVDSEEDDGMPERDDDCDNSDDESVVECKDEEPRNVFQDPTAWDKPRRSEAATRRDTLTHDKRGEPATEKCQATQNQERNETERVLRTAYESGYEDVFDEEEFDRLEQLHMLCSPMEK